MGIGSLGLLVDRGCRHVEMIFVTAGPWTLGVVDNRLTLGEDGRVAGLNSIPLMGTDSASVVATSVSGGCVSGTSFFGLRALYMMF